MARAGAAHFWNQAVVSLSMFGAHLDQIFPGISPLEKLSSVYAYYHLTSRKARSKNKFIIKDNLAPYLANSEHMSQETAMYNINIGLKNMMGKFTAPEQDA